MAKIVHNSKADKWPQIRVTKKAHQHANKIMLALLAQGFQVSKTSWFSELILAQPVPNGSKPVASEPVKE